MKRTVSRRAVTLVVIVAAMLLAAIPSLPATHAQSGGTLGYGSKVIDTISADRQAVLYGFNGTAGELVQIAVKAWSEGLNPQVELVTPNQAVLASNFTDQFSAQTQDAYLSVFLPETGYYTLTITGRDGTTGQFLLALQGRTPVERMPLLLNNPVNVTIPVDASPQYFEFEANACPTTLTLQNVASGRPYTFPFVAKVRDERGTEIALLLGGEELEDRVTVAAMSGRYEVEVLSAHPEIAGELILVITCAEMVPACVPGTVDGGIAAGDGGRPEGCPPCPTWPGGGCADLGFAAVMTNPAAKEIAVTWNPVTDADTFAIHVYIIHPGGEFLHGTLRLHADVTEWLSRFDYLPPEFQGLRFEIQVLRDEEVLCADSRTVMFEDTAEAGVGPCFDFALVVTEQLDESLLVEWGSYPDAVNYALFVFDETGAMVNSLLLPPSQHSLNLELPPGTYTVQVGPIVADVGMVCPQEITVTFESLGPVRWGPGA